MPTASLMNSNKIPLAEIKSALTRHDHKIYDAVMDNDKAAVLTEIAEHYKSFYKILSSRAHKRLDNFALSESSLSISEARISPLRSFSSIMTAALLSTSAIALWN